MLALKYKIIGQRLPFQFRLRGGKSPLSPRVNPSWNSNFGKELRIAHCFFVQVEKLACRIEIENPIFFSARKEVKIFHGNKEKVDVELVDQPTSQSRR